jgi:hypothetical protein
MKIHLNFKGIPILYKALNKQWEFEFDFPGKTLRELSDSLIKKYGQAMKMAIIDNNGNIDMEIRVVLNSTKYLIEDRMTTILNDGDSLTFMGAS